MSTDLKIDLFARDLFDALWRHHGLRKGPPKSKHPPVQSEFNETILRGVEARQAFFHSTYEEIFRKSHKEFAGNSMRFFYTIVEKFPHHWKTEDPDDDMVMSLFLCSCAFVADMCMRCKAEGDDLLDVGPKVWAMYTDMYLKDDFYVAGGWEQLQVFAETDFVVYDYMKMFSEVTNFKLVKNVLRHSPYVTISAIESFHSFEYWPGVNDDDPMALEWVDFCVLEPPMKIHPPLYFKQAIPSMFEELERAIYDLGFICNPYYPDDDSDATESIGTCSPNLDLYKKSGIASCHPNFSNASSLPTTPTSHFDDTDRGNIERCVFGSNAVKLKTIAQTPEASVKPVHNGRLSAADKTSDIDGGQDKNSESPSSITEKGNREESFTQTDKEKRESDIADFEEEDIVVKKLRSSSEGKTDSKHKKIETNGELIPHNENVLPVSSASSDCRMDYDRALKETLSALSSLGVTVTILDPADFNAENDNDESNMHTDPNDLGAILDQLGLKKMSHYVSSDSRRSLELYVKPINFDNSTISDGTLGETLKRSLSSSKSPLTSSNVNVSNTQRKSPLTSTNISVTSITDGTLYKRMDSSGSGGKIRGKRCTGKENFLLYDSRTETKVTNPYQKPLTVSSSPNSSMEVKARKSKENKHPDKDSFSPKNLPCFKDKTDSSKPGKVPSLADEYINKDDELVNLAEYSKKTYGRTERLELENKTNNENLILDNQKTSEHTTESQRTDVNDIKTVLPAEYPSRISTCEDLNFPQNQSEDEKLVEGKIDEKSSSNHNMQTPSCSDVAHQNSIITNDVENDLILEKSLTVPAEKNEYELINRRISQDSSSTEIYEMTEGENSSAEPSMENPFRFASGADAEITLDCDKSLNTEIEMASAETTNETPFGFDGEKAKKSKQELNSNDSNREAREALLTTEKSENITAEPELENPSGFPSAPQEVGNKGKKKRPKKRITRLEQRVKEDGNNVVRDLMKLILVMGYQPGIKYVGSTLQDPEKQNSEDENNEE